MEAESHGVDALSRLPACHHQQILHSPIWCTPELLLIQTFWLHSQNMRQSQATNADSTFDGTWVLASHGDS